MMTIKKPRHLCNQVRGVADYRGVDMSESTRACLRPTKRFPAGRTGTPAGYAAHRDAGEDACQPCKTAQTQKTLIRRRTLSEEDLAKYRTANADFTRRRREQNPEKVREEKHRRMSANREIIRAAKSTPCTDCDVQYPYYVMQFDHLGDKEFNIGHRGPTLGEARLMAEIAKCEVVCANCHAERTHHRLSEKEEVMES